MVNSGNWYWGDSSNFQNLSLNSTILPCCSISTVGDWRHYPNICPRCFIYREKTHFRGKKKASQYSRNHLYQILGIIFIKSMAIFRYHICMNLHQFINYRWFSRVVAMLSILAGPNDFIFKANIYGIIITTRTIEWIVKHEL